MSLNHHPHRRTITAMSTIAVALVAAGCTSDQTTGGQPETTVPQTESTELSTEQVVDLTKAILHSTDPTCATHSGTYTSTVTDVITGAEFIGELSITVGEDVCTLASNQIPNHDMGVDAEFPAEVAPVA